MSHLLDVSFLIACGWTAHGRHMEANRWLETRREFATCPVVQTGFLRVSMNPAYRASFLEAREALDDILSASAHRFLADEVHAGLLPVVAHRQEVTDAHLVTLASRYGLQLATLDDVLCRKPWATGIAVNPL